LEREIEALGLALDVITAPYNVGGIWYGVSCTFEEASLRARLSIPASVTFEEYDGRVAGSDATWGCAECGRYVMGLHPRHAPPFTARLA
jgi:hypothetical protein